MNILIWTIFLVYRTLILFIFLYSISQLTLTLSYRKSKRNRKTDAEPPALDEYPIVTIQLPIFNEKYVAERLIESTLKIDYPQDKLEIQVLDDSTDETFELVANKVGQFQQEGFDTKHIHRVKRMGFKAGALAEGLTVAKGEFVAIF